MKLKKLKKILKIFLKRQFLFYFYILMVLSDYLFTVVALKNGFYESNQFSNKFGLEIHLIILCLIGIIVYILCNHKNKIIRISSKLYYLIFNLIWLINNFYSMYLLNTI